jgi:hypothetical protein
MMSDRLPSDLPGGWEFYRPFKAKPLAKGQVWRKCGPLDAVKIVRVMIPGHSEYDGGAHGISVRHTVVGRKAVTWQRKTWFKLGTEVQIHKWLKQHGYALVL